jgi:hypothetical protein
MLKDLQARSTSLEFSLAPVRVGSSIATPPKLYSTLEFRGRCKSTFSSAAYQMSFIPFRARVPVLANDRMVVHLDVGGSQDIGVSRILGSEYI